MSTALACLPKGREQSLRMYLTNVRDPLQLPIADIARLYARRWDIELAFRTYHPRPPRPASNKKKTKPAASASTPPKSRKAHK